MVLEEARTSGVVQAMIAMKKTRGSASPILYGDGTLYGVLRSEEMNKDILRVAPVCVLSQL